MMLRERALNALLALLSIAYLLLSVSCGPDRREATSAHNHPRNRDNTYSIDLHLVAEWSDDQPVQGMDVPQVIDDLVDQLEYDSFDTGWSVQEKQISLVQVCVDLGNYERPVTVTFHRHDKEPAISMTLNHQMEVQELVLLPNVVPKNIQSDLQLTTGSEQRPIEVHLLDRWEPGGNLRLLTVTEFVRFAISQIDVRAEPGASHPSPTQDIEMVQVFIDIEKAGALGTPLSLFIHHREIESVTGVQFTRDGGDLYPLVKKLGE